MLPKMSLSCRLFLFLLCCSSGYLQRGRSGWSNTLMNRNSTHTTSPTFFSLPHGEEKDEIVIANTSSSSSMDAMLFKTSLPSRLSTLSLSVFLKGSHDNAHIFDFAALFEMCRFSAVITALPDVMPHSHFEPLRLDHGFLGHILQVC